MSTQRKTQDQRPRLDHEPRIRARISRVAVALTETDPALEIVFWRVQQIPKRPRIK